MATTSATSNSLALSGLASGIDWTSIVNELLTVERAPETQWQAQQTANTNKSTAYQGISTQLTTLNKDIATLSAPSFFDSRTTSLSNPAIGTATAASGTALGNYAFKVSQIATDAVQMGTAGMGKALSATDDVSGLTLGNAGFGTPITAGTFTVNGKAITISTSDTLQSVFDQISAATGGTVTASYDSNTDEISLNSSGSIILGSSADTSNFLQAAELFNNGTGTVTSASALGGVNLSVSLDDANFATAVSDGGSGAGEFMINGVKIDFNTDTDAVNDILQRINNSTAGVTATYDAVNDRFELTNKSTGDVGISMQDVTGNFLAATGLTGGTLQRGTNLLYTVNGGGTLTSQSNSVAGNSSGISGLSFTALSEGTTTISISSDTSTISAAISSFVTDYNAAQSYISTQIKPVTDSSGNVTAGPLTGDLDAEDIAYKLRQLSDASPGLTGVIQSISDLGILSNGSDNTLALSDPTSLNNALENNLDAVKQLFTNSTTGIGATLGAYLTNVTSSNGVLASDVANMKKQNDDITTSINALEERITNDQTRLTNEFINMETVINSLNTQKQYLNSYFSSSSASANTAPSAASSSSTG